MGKKIWQWPWYGKIALAVPSVLIGVCIFYWLLLGFIAFLGLLPYFLLAYL
jgi:hypothetical protein